MVNAFLTCVTENTSVCINDMKWFKKISCQKFGFHSSEQTHCHLWAMRGKPNHVCKLKFRLSISDHVPGWAESETAKTCAFPLPKPVQNLCISSAKYLLRWSLRLLAVWSDAMLIAVPGLWESITLSIFYYISNLPFVYNSRQLVIRYDVYQYVTSSRHPFAKEWREVFFIAQFSSHIWQYQIF